MELPEWLNKQAWEEFTQHRIEIKKPLTPLAAKKNMSVLEKQKNLQQDIVDNCIKNNWRGLFNITEKLNTYMPQTYLPKGDQSWIKYGNEHNQLPKTGESMYAYTARLKTHWEKTYAH